jgi:imidazolonepropionase-like amidohydrolase
LDSERRRHVEALLDRKHAALFQVRDEAEIDVALQLIAKYKLRGVLLGAEEFRSFLPEIKRLEVGLIARPVRPADPHRYIDSLVAASQAGIPIAFGMGTGDQLRLTASLAVNSGMSREAALLALTGGAAQMLGMPPGIGRIEPGQPADLVIWSGSPLNLGATPLQVLVDGRPWNAEPTATEETTVPADQRLAGEE